VRAAQLSQKVPEPITLRTLGEKQRLRLPLPQASLPQASGVMAMSPGPLQSKARNNDASRTPDSH
jgi:hypothetical protein